MARKPHNFLSRQIVLFENIEGISIIYNKFPIKFLKVKRGSSHLIAHVLEQLSLLVVFLISFALLFCVCSSVCSKAINNILEFRFLLVAKPLEVFQKYLFLHAVVRLLLRVVATFDLLFFLIFGSHAGDCR